MEKLFNLLKVPEPYVFLFFLLVFSFLFVYNNKKERKYEQKKNKDYWTKKRLAEYEQAKKESEKKGIPY